MKDPTPKGIDQFIERLVRGKLEDGQLSDCQLSLRDIDQIQSAVKTIRELQPVKDGWFKKNFKSAKERYAAAHADELKRYNSAYRLLKKLCGRTDVDLKALSAEHHALEKKVIVKTDELETIRGDLKELRTIRYYVSRVLPEEPAPENVPVQVQLSEGRLRSGIDQEKKQRTPKKQMEKHIEESHTKRRSYGETESSEEWMEACCRLYRVSEQSEDGTVGGICCRRILCCSVISHRMKLKIL